MEEIKRKLKKIYWKDYLMMVEAVHNKKIRIARYETINTHQGGINYCIEVIMDNKSVFKEFSDQDFGNVVSKLVKTINKERRIGEIKIDDNELLICKYSLFGCY